jgi:hypothetical protein
MARGFSARRSNLVRGMPPQCPRDKETMVARRECQQTQPREIRVTFAPSLLSCAAVAHAYEQVIPIVRRLTARSTSDDCSTVLEPPSSWASESASTG